MFRYMYLLYVVDHITNVELYLCIYHNRDKTQFEACAKGVGCAPKMQATIDRLIDRLEKNTNNQCLPTGSGGSGITSLSMANA